MRTILKAITILIGVCVFSSGYAVNVTLYLCEGFFASCGSVSCYPDPSNTDVAICKCNTKFGKSLGYDTCKATQKVVGDYETITSRYKPPKKAEVATCKADESNKSAWANCLGAPCVVDKKDQTTAYCACPIVQGEANKYVLMGLGTNPSICTYSIWSGMSEHDYKGIKQMLQQHQGLF